MMTRRSEISQITSATPSKCRRSERIVAKPTESAKAKTPVRRIPSRTRGAPIKVICSDSSSSSSSDEDEEDAVKEKDLASSEDEFSDEIDEDFSHLKTSESPGDKENRRRTRSQSRGRNPNEETPSKRVARDLKAMCNVNSTVNVRTPKSVSKNLSNSKGKNPAKSATRSRRVFREDSDAEDFSDELGDEEVTKKIEETRIQKTRTPLKMIIKLPKAEPKVTPLRIAKTPRGSLYIRKTRLRRQQESDEEEQHEEPISFESTAGTLKELASRLHLSKIPEKLPCREYESREIEKFIREVIDPKRGESSAMYISGVPGTGKTATLRAVVNAMQKNKKCPKFIYVEVNAMIFKKTVFVELYNGIHEGYNISKKSTNSKISATTARQALNSIFKKEDPNRPPIVILIDELDSLCNRKQDVLYDIFEWTALPQSKVTIIGIANTLDFPERMLCQRNASRLDKRRLVFQPYQHEQIQEIVRARLHGSKLVAENAVELVAKKIAMNTGDLRQALDFLCRAINVAVEQKAETLELRHVIIAQNAVLEPLKYRLVKGLRLHQFTLFRAVEAMTREQEEVIFANVYKTYCILCTELSGIAPASDSFAYKMLLQLFSTALVVLGKGDQGIMNRRIKLGMSSMEAEKAIKAATEKHKNIYSI
uniref:Origin recognition complex subunit 1 n=2 Tax=Caenorhabditis japonica TaxID=281687 RepID=A0A8R1HWP6_CAEJA